MSIQSEKVATILESAAAKFFLQKKDTLDGIVTVTGVDINKDKHHAIVWVAILGGDEEKFIKRLPVLQSQLRRYISTTESFRYTPHMILRLDTSSEYVQKISKLV